MRPDSGVHDRTALRLRVAAGLAVAAAVLAHVPTLGAEFFSDDFLYVVGNNAIREIPLWQPWRFFVVRTNSYEFLPIRDLSYRIDLALFGEWPAGFRIDNLVLYVVTCVAAWLSADALLRVLTPGRERQAGIEAARPWVPAIVTILFAVHPAHVESLAWVSGRKDILSALFSLVAIWQFALGLSTARRRHLLMGYGLFALALASKATVLPVAGVALLLALAHVRAVRGASIQMRRALWLAAPFVVLAIAWFWLVMRVGAEARVAMGIEALAMQRASQEVEALAALKILGHLTGIAVFPLQPRLFYDVALPPQGQAAVALVGAATIVAAGIGAIAAWRRGSVVGFGVAAFVGLCVPYLQLIPFKTWSLVSDRFVVLAVFGLGLAAAGLLLRLPIGPRVVILGVVAGGGLAVMAQTAWAWRSIPTLVERAARLAPGHYPAQSLYLDVVVLPENRWAEARAIAARVEDPVSRHFALTYVRARAAYSRRDWPTATAAGRELAYLAGEESAPNTQLLLGVLAEHEGNAVEAVRSYYLARRQARTRAELATARSGLERVRAAQVEALAAQRRAAAASPGDLRMQVDLANVELELFFVDEAARRYRALLREHPGLVAVRYNLGLAYLRGGRNPEAARELEAAIRGGVDTATSWNNLAIALRRSGRVGEARRAFTEAMRRSAKACHAAVNLGSLEMALGRKAAARRAFEQARDVACGDELQALVAAYLDRATRADED